MKGIHLENETDRYLESCRIWRRFRSVWHRFKGFDGLESQSRMGWLNSADSSPNRVHGWSQKR